MDYSTVPIKVLSSPTDWPTVYSAFAAAFFGAAAAFILNIFLERLRERQNRLSAINAAVYGLLMSMTTLVNLKEQFLTKFQQEFDELQKLMTSINLMGSPADIENSLGTVNAHLSGIGSQDRQLNGALIPWQETDFPMMPSPSAFLFTASANTDIVRLIHVSKTEMDGAAKMICTRNSYWHQNADATIDKSINGSPNTKKLTFIFQMLSFRRTIREHIDVALVVSQEALDQLEAYRKKKLKKHPWYSRWFFRLFTGEEAWVTYKQSPRIKKAIPDKAAYRSVLDLADQA